eukprot:TRINITY_DN25837_c0_g2_i2.p1 TRINITY_DN25837_c0_g2~~TRINITY_DN25837_c0_g2_i2.p1  ORF type:complete len:705 (+),score=136.58 TRINITY_DN25837_c0_g2_i2:81-2195(+)
MIAAFHYCNTVLPDPTRLHTPLPYPCHRGWGTMDAGSAEQSSGTPSPGYFPPTLQECVHAQCLDALPEVPPQLPFDAEKASAVLLTKPTYFTCDLSAWLQTSLVAKQKPSLLQGDGKPLYSEVGFMGQGAPKRRRKDRAEPSRAFNKRAPTQTPADAQVQQDKRPVHYSDKERAASQKAFKSGLTPAEHATALEYGPGIVMSDVPKDQAVLSRRLNHETGLFAKFATNIAMKCTLCSRGSAVQNHNHLNKLFLLEPVWQHFQELNSAKMALQKMHRHSLKTDANGHWEGFATLLSRTQTPMLHLSGQQASLTLGPMARFQHTAEYGQVGRVYHLRHLPTVPTTGGPSRQIDCRITDTQRQTLSLSGVSNELFFPALNDHKAEGAKKSEEQASAPQQVNRRKRTVQEQAQPAAPAPADRSAVRQSLFSSEKQCGVPLWEDRLAAILLTRLRAASPPGGLVVAASPAILAKLSQPAPLYTTHIIPLRVTKKDGGLTLVFGKSFATGNIRPKSANEKFFKQGVIHDLLLREHDAARVGPRPTPGQGRWTDSSLSLSSEADEDFDPTRDVEVAAEPSLSLPYENYTYSGFKLQGQHDSEVPIQMVLRSKTHAIRSDTQEMIVVHAHMEHACKTDLGTPEDPSHYLLEGLTTPELVRLWWALSARPKHTGLAFRPTPSHIPPSRVRGGYRRGHSAPLSVKNKDSRNFIQ